MSALGFVVIVYNQASHWPSLRSDALYDTIGEAEEQAQIARNATSACGRGETYSVAAVQLLR